MRCASTSWPSSALSQRCYYGQRNQTGPIPAPLKRLCSCYPCSSCCWGSISGRPCSRTTACSVSRGIWLISGLQGLLILIITIPYWTKDQPLWKQILIAIVILIITSAVGFSSFEDTDSSYLNTPVPNFLLDFPDLTPGSVTIDKILINKFQLEFSRTSPHRSCAGWFIPGDPGAGVGTWYKLVL